MSTYQHRITYYGPDNFNSVVKTLEELHVNKSNLKSVPQKMEFVENPMDEPIVYVLDYEYTSAGGDKALRFLVNLLKNLTKKYIEVNPSRETVLINSNFNCNYFIDREKLFNILKIMIFSGAKIEKLLNPIHL